MSQLGLGLNLSKTKGGVVPFNPLSLDPYLLFDTQSSMIGTFENPTLDLDPSVPSSLDIITATRAGTATVTDASGNIVDAAPNTVRVDHVQGEIITAARTNLMLYSEPSRSRPYFIGDSVNGYTGQTSEVTTEDNGMTVWNQWPDTGGVNSFVGVSGPTVSGQTYVGSCYIRMNDGGAPVAGETGWGDQSGADFLILTNGVDSIPNGGMEHVGGGLYRVWAYNQASNPQTLIQVGKYDTMTARGFRVSGFQLELGTTPTALIYNNTGAPITAPAVYGPRVPMILVEPSATNLVPSKVFSGVGTTTIASGFLAPDGSMDAYEVSNILDASSDRVYCAAAAVSGSTEYTGSLYVKGTAGEVATIQTKRFGAGAYSTSTTSVVTLTGSWQRVTGLTFTTAADNTQAVVSVRREAAATADTIQVWGAQFETGSVATSYIPTSGSTVTRAADDLVISGSDFSDFYNNSEGTIYCEFEYDFEPAYAYIYNIPQDGNNEIRNQFATSSNVRTRCVVAGQIESQIDVSGSIQGSSNRHAYSYKTNNFRGSINGSTEAEDLTGTASLSPIKIQMGGRGGSISNIKFKRLIYWPYHSDSL